MSNYVRSGPFVNGITPPGISAAFLNAVENVLEQPSGGTETGKYIVEFNASVANYFGSMYTPSISRTAVPVSVTIDTADVASTALNSGPSTQHLTANGFQTVAQSNGNVSDARGGGNYTINY